MGELDLVIKLLLARGTFDSGERRTIKIDRGGQEYGTPPPAYADETGETAITEPIRDAVERTIGVMANDIRRIKNNATLILTITPEDVKARAKRSAPDCAACGDPCIEGVRSGFDIKCFNRWKDGGSQDRAKFIRTIKQEVKDAVVASE